MKAFQLSKPDLRDWAGQFDILLLDEAQVQTRPVSSTLSWMKPRLRKTGQLDILLLDEPHNILSIVNFGYGAQFELFN